MDITPVTPPPPPLSKKTKKLKIVVESLVESSNHDDDPEMKYIESLSLKEQKAYLIAKNHLQSSFSLAKSNGFIKFMKDRK